MTTLEHLSQTFADNFVAYYRSHVAHVNIQGRNFQSDHTLLGEIYEDLQGQIDHIGELIRTLQGFMPDDLADVLQDSHMPIGGISGDSESLLTEVRGDLDHLRAEYTDLMTAAEAEGHQEISNYAQDRILRLAKFIWMLDSTLS